MTTNHSPLQILCLIINLAAAVLTALVAFSSLGRQYSFQEAIPGLLRNNLQKVDVMRPSPISPAPWLHCTWGFILIWQVLWSVHGLVSIFRSTYGFPVYTNPVLLSPLLLIVSTFGCGFCVSWFILYDRVYTSTSCLFIFLEAVTVWLAYAISLHALHWNLYRLEKSLRFGEIYLSRVLVQNGLASFAMWSIFVLAFNVSTGLIHNPDTILDKDDAAVVGLSIMAVVQLSYLLVDVICLDGYSRYIFTPYIVPIIVLSASLFHHDTWVSSDVNFAFLTALLAFSLVAIMFKSAWMAFKVIKHRSAGCDITSSGPTSPVDEAHYLLK